MAQLANLTTTLAIESSSFVNGIEQSRSSMARLVRELDPAAAAQGKFQRQTDALGRALAAGRLSGDQYALMLGNAEKRLQAVIARQQAGTESFNRMGSSGLIADHVVRAFSDSIAAGQSPMRAFTMEIGRVAEGLQLFAMQSGATEGAVGKLAGFLGSGWGIAATIALSALTPLVGKLFETKPAGDAAADGLDTEQKSAKSLEQAIHDLAVAQGKAIQTSYEARNAALAQAQGMRATEIQARRTAEALLEHTKAEMQLNKARIDIAAHDPRISGPLLATNSDLAGQMDKINSDIAKARKGIADANSAIASSKIAIMIRDVADANDKGSAATTQFEKTQARLNAQFTAGRISEAAYREQLDAATKARDAATASTDHHTRSTRAHTDAARGEAKAIREVEAAERARTQAINDLQAKYDPATAAVREYLDQLKQIASLKLDPATAALYAEGARKAFQEARAGMFDLESVDEFRVGADAADKAQKDAATAAKAMEDRLQQQKADNIRDLAGLYQDLFTGGTKALWRDFEQMGFHVLAELLAKQTLAGANGGDLFSGLLSGLGGLFGRSGVAGGTSAGFDTSIDTGISFAGFRAMGGGVDPMRAYVVGEKGPEVFVPKMNGSIIPNNALRSGVGGTGAGAGANDNPVAINVTVNARDAVLTDTVKSWVAVGVSRGLAEHDRQSAKRASRRLGRG